MVELQQGDVSIELEFGAKLRQRNGHQDQTSHIETVTVAQ